MKKSYRKEAIVIVILKSIELEDTKCDETLEMLLLWLLAKLHHHLTWKVQNVGFVHVQTRLFRVSQFYTFSILQSCVHFTEDKDLRREAIAYLVFMHASLSIALDTQILL